MGIKSGLMGFTLLEMLVVLAIIAILVALAYPAITQATKTAKQSRSISNLKTLGMACIAYANDHNGNFPMYTITGKTQTTIGQGLSSGAGPRKLFNRPNYGIGQGDFDYLESPDPLYSPFADRMVRIRKRGEIFKDPTNGALVIGYYSYSMPHENAADPTKAILVEGLFNERLIDGGRAPLFSEFLAGNSNEEFSSDWFTFVRTDGSVHAMRQSEAQSFNTWSARIKRMAEIQ